jgi:micrococcal nuclease
MVKDQMAVKWCLLCLLVFIHHAPAVAQRLKGKVTGIKDGDTIEIVIDGKSEKVRLFGIDCPEKSQDFGTKAKEFTAANAFGKYVSVEVHGRDKYKRLLGVVLLPGGENLNLLLVKSGYAWRYRYSRDKLLLRLEQEARMARRGLWSMPSAQAPWDFRKQKKTKKK